MGSKLSRPLRKRPKEVIPKSQSSNNVSPNIDFPEDGEEYQEFSLSYPNGPTSPVGSNLTLQHFSPHQSSPLNSPTTSNHGMQMSNSSYPGNFLPRGAEPNFMPPAPTSSDDEIVVCLFDFTARVHRELGFKTNDRLKVVRREDEDWLYALHLDNNKKGLIPSNYVASEKSLKSYEWYFGDVSRRNAESLLRRMEPGTFLVRDSRTQPGDFALSIKSSKDNGPQIRHYIIKFINGHYSIFNKIRFANLNELLQEYKVRSHGISVLLTQPCPKMMPTRYDLSADTKDDWEIDRSEIQLEEEIGHGNFGSVYRGYWRGTTEVAVKTLIIGKMSSETFLEEAKIMKGLRHENILALMATCSKEEPIYIITEYMKLGSLLSLLKEYKRSPQSLDEDHMLGFAFQISKGMEYLEQKRLVHRDLAARNVLVNDVPICKIADFGLAKIVKDETSICKDKFPVKWAPPETFLRGEFSIKSDVWAFGIVVMEIFTYGDPVYPGMTPKEVQQNVKNGYRLPRPDLMKEPTYEVLRKCWSKEPDNRPEFAALAEFFDESRNKHVDGTQYLTEDDVIALQARQ